MLPHPSFRLFDTDMTEPNRNFFKSVQFFTPLSNSRETIIPMSPSKTNENDSWAMVESPHPIERLEDQISEETLQQEVMKTVTQAIDNLRLPTHQSLVADGHLFVLNLTTGTAMNCPLAAIFATALPLKLGMVTIASELAEKIEFCLAEVVANAIIHGNLGLNRLWHSAPEAIDKRLEFRRLTLLAVVHNVDSNSQQLEIIVSDAGEKFSTKFIPRLPCRDEIDQNQTPRGRGLAIIRELGVELGCVVGNNSVRLSFPWTN